LWFYFWKGAEGVASDEVDVCNKRGDKRKLDQLETDSTVAQRVCKEGAVVGVASDVLDVCNKRGDKRKLDQLETDSTVAQRVCVEGAVGVATTAGVFKRGEKRKLDQV
jgi:CTP-dependent riboflavin kinase